MPSSTSLDRFLAVALDGLTKGHTPAILDRIQPGEVGCSSCGHVAIAGDFTRPPRRHAGRRCPACTTDIDSHGYIDGSSVALAQAS